MDQERLNTFINQHVSTWHEPDPARRREIVGALFAEDAENYTRKLAVRGMDEIVARVTRAHEEWVASKGFVFRPAGNADAHPHVIKFLGRCCRRHPPLHFMARDATVSPLHQSRFRVSQRQLLIRPPTNRSTAWGQLE